MERIAGRISWISVLLLAFAAAPARTLASPTAAEPPRFSTSAPGSHQTVAPLPELPPLESYLAPPATEPGPCDLSREESALARQLTDKRLQQRRRLVCNPRLVTFARARARDFAERQYFAHVTPDRVGPNDLLRAWGYSLPDHYSRGLSNNVEAIAGGLAGPEAVWKALLDSTAHRVHLLGELPFYQEQDEFGIAHYYDPDTPHSHYWVVVLARPRKPGDPRMICTPAPGPCFNLSDGPGR
jgi:uncharacterized protein YkwD